MHRSAIVVGAGIAGLAMTRALAVRGYKVTVIERTEKAVGASIRNFGMVWPVGQPEGEWYEKAMLSRSIWKQVCDEAKTWYDEVGSLHLAYSDDELNVISEFTSLVKRSCEIISPAKATQLSEAINANGLLGALWSPDEMIVDPRIAIANISAWLQEKYGVKFLWGKTVTDVAYPSVFMGIEEMEANEIFICSGADFETLFPEVYAKQAITKCKLQMMRMIAQPNNWRIGPALCGGLSLTHYKSFSVAPSLQQLKERYEQEYPDYVKWGIHVMVSQNQVGELTVGDSHEYGLTYEPFDKVFINELILKYLERFAHFKNEQVIETWNGIYPKLTNGESIIILKPQDGVTIINGLGGAGMTLSFGVCEGLLANS